MRDNGAISQIIAKLRRFKKCNDSFKLATHCTELAVATRCYGVAKRKKEAEVTGRQELLTNGAAVIFKEGENILHHRGNKARLKYTIW